MLILLALNLGTTEVSPAPVCSTGETGCRFISIDDLFDRVILHSSKLHSIASDLYTDVEQHFLTSKNQLGRSANPCHTASIRTPNGKENVQKVPGEELTQVILRLLLAWKDPLLRLHKNIGQYEEFSVAGHTRTKEISDMVQSMRSGVEKVAEKMKSLQIINNSLYGLPLPKNEDLSESENTEAELLTDFELLHCFRRDSDKIQNYLRMLKCRIVPENKC
ncbi:prolactin-like [Protopterus annectens]|uniref:prolactin-like n=1 Tax=Protopterus annectens TaxID=7888 RepID=UPI001CFB1A48|nr:prolactin-like [Protopterus annectens]